MNILISLFFSITIAFSVFAEDVVIIELHDETIDQMLLNASSDNDDEKNWYKRARNYFSIYSTIKSFRILNETEGSFIKSFDSLLTNFLI